MSFYSSFRLNGSANEHEPHRIRHKERANSGKCTAINSFSKQFYRFLCFELPVSFVKRFLALSRLISIPDPKSPSAPAKHPLTLVEFSGHPLIPEYRLVFASQRGPNWDNAQISAHGRNLRMIPSQTKRLFGTS